MYVIIGLLYLITCGLANYICFITQVITRLIASSSPIIYWYVAVLTTPQEQLRPQRANRYDDVYQHNEHNQQMTDRPNGDKVRVQTSITDDVMDWESKGFTSKMLFAYFHLYFFVGIAAFSNFLPWT